MENVVDQENAKNVVDTYDQFVEAEVCLPDERGRKMMSGFTQSVKDN